MQQFVAICCIVANKYAETCNKRRIFPTKQRAVRGYRAAQHDQAHQYKTIHTLSSTNQHKIGLKTTS